MQREINGIYHLSSLFFCSHVHTLHRSPTLLFSLLSFPGPPGRKGISGITIGSFPRDFVRPLGDMGYPGERGGSGAPGVSGQPGVPGRPGKH